MACLVVPAIQSSEENSDEIDENSPESVEYHLV